MEYTIDTSSLDDLARAIVAQLSDSEIAELKVLIRCVQYGMTLAHDAATVANRPVRNWGEKLVHGVNV